VVITELQPITVVFNVAEDHLGEVQAQLRQQRPLLVEAFDRSAETKVAVGSLLSVDNQIDTSTGTVRFRGEFSNRDLALFPKPVRQCATLGENTQRFSSDSKRRDPAQWNTSLCLRCREECSVGQEYYRAKCRWQCDCCGRFAGWRNGSALELR